MNQSGGGSRGRIQGELGGLNPHAEVVFLVSVKIPTDLPFRGPPPPPLKNSHLMVKDDNKNRYKGFQNHSYKTFTKDATMYPRTLSVRHGEIAT